MLDVEPAYEVRQRVFEGLCWEALLEHLDEIFASGYSVSAFTRWDETVDQVWTRLASKMSPRMSSPSSSAPPPPPRTSTRSSG
jgi:hypothetical protein